jgi:hypothetical protein
MRHRIALVVGSVAASATLAVALTAAGFAPPDPSLANAVAPPSAPQTQVDTVYLPAPVDPPTITVHQTVTSGGESEDGGRERGDD